MQHRSPGLTAIYNEIRATQTNRILDLGSLVSANFEFFSRLSCHLHYENLDSFIEEYGELSGDNQALRLKSFLLNPKEDQAYDVILMWDLLNYLTLPAIKTLFNFLNQICRNNTLVHTVKYLGNNIPPRPARFKIEDQYHIDIKAEKSSPRQVNALATAALLKEIPRYYLHNNLMHEQGMIAGIAEQVMRFNPDKDLRKQYVSRTEFVNSQTPINPVEPRSRQKKTANPMEKPYTSPSVKEVMQNFSYHKTLLDCGLKSSHNMDFWRQHFDKVYSEDLPSSLHWLSHTNRFKEGNAQPISHQALQFAPELHFDVITVWDIFNFCSPDQISAIGERLSKHCHENTRILAITYSGDTIPEHPQKYELIKDGYQCTEHMPRYPRVHPASTTASLIKLIPFWTIEKTHFFSSGMKSGIAEIIFKPRSTP